MATNNDKIQFRGADEKRASQRLSEMRLGGINISELAREGLKEKLREALSNEERVELHQQYLDGELDEGVAEILIGDLLEDIEREREAVGKAETLSADGVFQNK
ncbi:hypothetical protein [Haloferax larsenii]|uniref:Uncharacterized protein n=1 Tax=Haloferax larsenii TaxID=302484 RepID=A0A1H7TT24_HALLR|nr:hypothetical protein [Haloferax larsenii]SEL87596.1 hypothetical protein SAMN04488691_11035 [Haloferax larsenii]